MRRTLDITRYTCVGLVALLALGTGCGPGRYEILPGAEVAKARFTSFFPDFSNRHIEYDVVLRDGDTCSALGKVPLEQYRGPLFGNDHEAARADFAKSALALGLPDAPKIDYGTIVKEMLVAAGKPIVVVGSHLGAPNFDTGTRSLCKAETRFTPEKDGIYRVDFSILRSDRCWMRVEQLVQTAAGPKWKGLDPIGKGCLGR